MEQQRRVQCYAAPLEGITGYIYRNAHHQFFKGVDKYFTPFVTPKPKKGLNTREKNDILPEHNQNIPVVPQILTNGTGDPMRSTMTLIMFLNNHLYSKNYGMAGAVSVVLFIITGILSIVVFKVTGNDKRKG